MKTKKAWETQLKRSAKLSCEDRGHVMTNFHNVVHLFTNPNEFISHCKYCGLEVYVELNPMPNSTNIFGQAVAVDCAYNK